MPVRRYVLRTGRVGQRQLQRPRSKDDFLLHAPRLPRDDALNERLPSLRALRGDHERRDRRYAVLLLTERAASSRAFAANQCRLVVVPYLCRVHQLRRRLRGTRHGARRPRRTRW